MQNQQAAQQDMLIMESDPTGRYQRYSCVIGRGSAKTVYRAMDSFTGTEMAWCKTSISNVDDKVLLMMKQEIQMLQSLNHANIVKVYDSWTNTSDKSLNFITELCSSSLKSYYQHENVEIKNVKQCARQLLSAMVYMHSKGIIHRDIKCGNFLVKQNADGEASFKIADFGLAAYATTDCRMKQIVGTAEFIAPEMFNQDYNQLADIYSFGMSMLELITGEYPYSEYRNPGHIYKTVISNVKPNALLYIQDKEMLRFINRCILPEADRPSATELLLDPFLQEESCASTFQVFGRVLDCSTLELKVCVKRSSGRRQQQNIVFPFDLKSDSALGVAQEMGEQLGFCERDVLTIANLINREVLSLSMSCSIQSCSSLLYHSHPNDLHGLIRSS